MVNPVGRGAGGVRARPVGWSGPIPGRRPKPRCDNAGNAVERIQHKR